MTHSFTLPAADLKRLIDRSQFAISTEETRYYLNGIYLHTAGSAKAQTLRGVATDGHRLAQIDLPLPKGASGMPGVIVPRKTVGEVQRLIEDTEAEVGIELSQGKIRFTIGNVVLTSKLIDGTFPDYGRVVPLVSPSGASMPVPSVARPSAPSTSAETAQEPSPWLSATSSSVARRRPRPGDRNEIASRQLVLPAPFGPTRATTSPRAETLAAR